MLLNRKCKTCKKELSIDNFAFSHKKQGYRRWVCKPCIALKYTPNKEKYLEYKLKEKERNLLSKEGKRRCGSCQKIKSFDEFNKSKGGFLGYASDCRVCSQELWKNYYYTPEKHEELKEKHRIRKENERTPEQAEKYFKEKAYKKELHILQEQGKRRCRMCEEIKVLDDFPYSSSPKVFYNRKSYCKKCAYETWKVPIMKTERYKKMKAGWDKKSSKKHRVKRNASKMRKYHSDPQTKLKINLRSRLGRIIRKNNITKTNSALTLVGCDLPFLIKYLEDQFKEGMSWHNWSLDGWHIDHIIPLDAFDLTDIEEQKKAFHYTNLQPLWAKENLSKGNRING